MWRRGGKGGAAMAGEQDPDLVQAYLELDPISVCNRLAAALADAAHGWRVAAEAVEAELGEEMVTIARRREGFATELSNVVSGRSGEVVEDHTKSGRLLTWWLEIRASTARDKTLAVLKVCQTGSHALRREYAHAMDTALPEPIRAMVAHQLTDIEATAAWVDGEVDARS